MIYFKKMLQPKKQVFFKKNGKQSTERKSYMGTQII